MSKKTRELLSEIVGFIDVLRKNGYKLSVSCFSPVFAPVLPALMNYEVHLPAFCNYLKSNAATFRLCVENKEKLKRKKTPCAYYSCCYAGVEEFVYPIEKNGTRIFCFNLSGYRGTLKKSALFKERVRTLCDEKFDGYYAELSPFPPSLSDFTSLLRPIERSVCALYDACLEQNESAMPKDKLYLETLAFLHENYTQELSAESTAAALNYSESYLRHVFREKSGVTFAQYVNSLRLTRAKELLENGRSVAETAFLCGFLDPNYFSVAFKKKYGITPRNMHPKN